MPPKRKQSKSNWRKRGASTEAELRAVRQRRDQERRTGGSVAHLADAALFRVDGKGGSSGAAPRRGGAQKPLWVDANVAPNPHTQPVRAAQAAPKAAPRRLPPPAVKLEKLRGALQRRRAQNAPAPPAAGGVDALDIWAAEPVAAPKRRHKLRAPEASAVPAVAAPAGGASYNPAADDHQALIGEAVGHELERQRREKLYRHPTFDHPEDDDGPDEDSLRWSRGAAFPRLPAPEAADGGEVVEDADADADAADADEGEGYSHRERSKLTISERNRQRRVREREAGEAAKRKERKAARQLDRVDTLLGEIGKEAKRLRKRQAAEASAAAARRPKLGKRKHEARMPDVLLTEELPSALRALPAQSSLLLDRYESLKARNIIEPRERVPKVRKARLKMVTTESHKGTRFKSPHALKAGIDLPAWM